MYVTLYDIAQRFVGQKEVPGDFSNPAVLAMLRLDNPGIKDDETPWCSGFMNWCAWLLRLPRSKSLAARSWLGVGHAVALDKAEVGYDVVVLSRPAAGPAAGHVGLFAGLSQDGKNVLLLGGNQGDAVSIAEFPVERIVGIRRLES
jgi:uncharacterized protein (TIGR02594 family)